MNRFEIKRMLFFTKYTTVFLSQTRPSLLSMITWNWRWWTSASKSQTPQGRCFPLAITTRWVDYILVNIFDVVLEYTIYSQMYVANNHVQKGKSTNTFTYEALFIER